MAIDKKPIQDLPVKHFGDKHFSSEFNTVRKSLLDIIDGINAVPAMIESDFKGIIAPSDPAPTEDGTYKPSVYSADPGTNYPNAGNLKAKEGYITYFYKKGSVWTKSEIAIPGVNVATEFDPTNDTDAQAGKQIAEYVNFNARSFNYVLDFSKDNYGKYSELLGTTTFSEGTGSVFGKIAYVKLTGGSVVFPSSFAPQLGTADYDPTKTNVIAFWKEYDKVRYFNEVFTLEPLPVDGIITYYNFNGKTPNALLSTITPNFGTPFTGNTSGFRINTSGGWLRNTATATSINAAISIDVGSITHYKATLYLSLSHLVEVNIGTTAYNVWNDYVDIRLDTTSTILHVKPSTPAGDTIYSSSTIVYPNTGFYKWEFVVNGNNVTIFYEGSELVSYTHSNTGNLFSIILKDIDDSIQSIKIEEL